MLAAFKRILINGISVRGAEEVARQVKSEIQKKEPHKRMDRIYIPEQEKMSSDVKGKYGFHKVDFSQSRILGKVVILIKGEEEETSKKLKEIYNILMN